MENLDSLEFLNEKQEAIEYLIENVVFFDWKISLT